ncbi:MAG: hypothetical protein JWL63_3202 [Rhodocyclales bacterium]|nr:hypothetical protein [Rhodocyclales bacterium]
MSEALIETGLLDVGINVGGVVHRHFSLRVAKLSDAYVATAAVLIPDNLGSVMQPGQAVPPEYAAARLAYEMQISDAMLLAQLIELGDLNPVPSIQVLMESLDPEDAEIVREKAKVLKKRRKESSASSPASDTSKPSSLVPASA